MSLAIHKLGTSIEIVATQHGLLIRDPAAARDVSRRENWPQDALASPGGYRGSTEVAQLLELGLAEERGDGIVIPFENFRTIENEYPVELIAGWVQPSPFLLKIDRRGDLGRPDFEYRYQFLLGGRAVHLDRVGYYVRRGGANEVFILDSNMYCLVESMDAFNALPARDKTPQRSWLTFATVKGFATDVGAALDGMLQKNDVIVPSTIGLDMREDSEGALSFLPRCKELSGEDFHQVFERNPGAEKLYSLDKPGLARVRIVLTDAQHEVLRRMKRVTRVRGELKDRLKQDPVQVFDGIVDHIELPYGSRVIGIGDFPFVPVQRPGSDESTMAELWQGAAVSAIPDPPRTGGEETQVDQIENPRSSMKASPAVPTQDSVNLSSATGNPSDAEASQPADEPKKTRDKKALLIKTNEESLSHSIGIHEDHADLSVGAAVYSRPSALRADRILHPHQETGVEWLQTCSQVQDRRGVLLADDMGVGKTIQILTFLAWCIESGKFPDLAKPTYPYRPILIVVPLILLDTRTWEKEMERFFENDGAVFWPVLSLHGGQLAQHRRRDAEGPELEIGKPILDLNRIQRHRVVITNYETVKNYQHSFAYFKDGKSLWSLIVTDEAQEYKVPNTRISHAMKALQSDFQIACTGTPVENRLLDLWNIFDSIQPGLLPSAREFSQQYEGQMNGEARQQSLGELKKQLLFQQPHAFFMRRNKSDVANLPPKHIVKVKCSMSENEIAVHQLLLKELASEGGRSRFLNILHKFAQLYQHPALLTADAEENSSENLKAQSSKLRALLQQLHVIRGSREKAIIFARHRVMQGILAKVLQSEFQLPVRIINGDTKMGATSLRPQGIKTRESILNDFKAKPGFNALILSPFVAGIGLTITEANHVFHYGRWWNPAVESQATDRTYRIGQTKDVFVYLPILRDPTGRVSPSFDERLEVLMNNKYRLAEDFLRPLAPEDELGDELFTELRSEAQRLN